MIRVPFRKVLLTVALIPISALAGTSVLAVHAQAAAAPSPQTFSLKASDVPHGYKQTIAKTETAAQVGVSSVTARQLQQHGYGTSYLVQFETSDGNYVVNSHAYVFKNVADAQWFEHATTSTSAALNHFTAVSVPTLGDSSHGLTRTLKQGKTTYAFYALSVRRGNLFVGVIVGGPKGKVKLSQAVSYARLLAGRM